MELQQILIPVMTTCAVGGIVYAVGYPYLSGNSQADKRRAALQTRSAVKAGGRGNDAAKRRKQVTDSLKEIDDRAKSKKVTLENRLLQAGLTWSKQAFFTGSGALGLVGAALGYLFLQSPLIAIACGIIAGAGLPQWYIGFLRKRRFRKFLDEFPGAVDIIVRGIKAGIPVGDCMRNISLEAAEPVRTEFRAIVEAQTVGLSLSEAVERLTERVPLPEANFFSIVINIQQKAGGNLAEALSNLSAVLRDRKKMKGKVKAMSSEAKASAGIIGALPPLVAVFVYLTSPAYISLLFTTTTGNIVLGASGFWMLTGVLVMKKMINFDI